MYIRIDEPDARKRVVAHLRTQGYLAAEDPGGVLVEPLDSVSDGHDLAALAELLRAFAASEGLTLNPPVTREPPPDGALRE